VDLYLSTRHEGDRTVIEVGGEIDVYTAPKLREQLVDLVNQGRYHLVVDMEADLPPVVDLLVDPVLLLATSAVDQTILLVTVKLRP